MAKQRAALQRRGTQPKRRAPKVNLEPMAAQAAQSQPLHESDVAFRDGSTAVQASMLTHTGLSSARRQAMAAQIGRVQGNGHLQRMLSSFASNSPTQASPAPSNDREPIPTEHASSGAVQRWAEHEHKAFGDLAAQMAMKRKWSIPVGGREVVPAGIGQESDAVHSNSASYKEFITGKVNPLKQTLAGAIGKDKLGSSGIGVAHEQEVTEHVLVGDVPVPVTETKKRKMSFGDATMLGGDYFKTAEGGRWKTRGLRQAQTVNPEEMTKRMYYVAATNVNHFFPLAGKEWAEQNKEAESHAGDAHTAYIAGNKAKGDQETDAAFRYLGIAIHFLQDSFASGHQYPRALDDIASSTAAGTAIYGLRHAKKYHDALCALPKGLPMQYGGGKRFHGDNTADASDLPVVQESSRAVVNLLTILTEGKDKRAAGGATPNPGPHVPMILADPEAGPIWVSMVGHLQKGKMQAARRAAKNQGEKKKYSTSAGTPYSAKEVVDALEGLHGVNGSEPSAEVYNIGIHGKLQIGLTKAQAIRELRRAANAIRQRIAISRSGHQYLKDIRDDQWIVGWIASTIGGTKMPSLKMWQSPLGILKRANYQIVKGNILLGASLLKSADKEYVLCAQRYQDYRRGSIRGAEIATSALEITAAAGAVAAGVATGGALPASIGLLGSSGAVALAGGGYGALQHAAGQAGEMYAGTRAMGEYDWQAIWRRGSTDVIAGFVGGLAGGALAKGLFQLCPKYLGALPRQMFSRASETNRVLIEAGLKPITSREAFVPLWQKFGVGFLSDAATKLLLEEPTRVVVNELTANQEFPSREQFLERVTRQILTQDAVMLAFANYVKGKL